MSLGDAVKRPQIVRPSKVKGQRAATSAQEASAAEDLAQTYADNPKPKRSSKTLDSVVPTTKCNRVVNQMIAVLCDIDDRTEAYVVRSRLEKALANEIKERGLETRLAEIQRTAG